MTLKTVTVSLVGALTLVACGEVASGPGGGGPGGGGDDDMAMPDAPAAAMFTLAVGTSKVPIEQGTSATVEVTVERVAPFAGPVTVTLGGLPAGVTAAPVTIASGETSAAFAIAAAADAPHSLPTDVVAIGNADGGAQAMAALTVTVCGHPGALDTSFGSGKVLQPMGASDDYAYAVAVQPDGKVLVAGSRYEHLGDFAILRLTRDGAPDPTFGTGGIVATDFGSFDSAYAIALQADGKIVVAGSAVAAGSSFDFAVARYLPDGTLDTSFSDDGKLTTAVGTDIDIARAVAIQPDGRIVVAGYSNRGTTTTGIDFALERYMGDGSIDPTWGTGLVITPMKANSGTDIVYGLALQQIDGETRVVAAGGDGDFILARYRANGALDTTFGTGGKIVGLYGSVIGSARAVVATSSGELYVAGHSQGDFALVKLTPAGQIDPSFGKITTPVSTTRSDEANAIALDGNQVIAAGWVSEPDSSAGNFAVTRYDAGGHLDAAFGEAGIVVTKMADATKPDVATAMALQVDERVPTVRTIVAGYASNTDNDFAIARYWR